MLVELFLKNSVIYKFDKLPCELDVSVETL